MMNRFSAQEYLVWYCDWCDSTNQIQRSIASAGELVCTACHHPRSDSDIEEFGPLPRAA